MLTAPTPGLGAEAGFAVAVDGTTIVLGAPGENANTGAIYVIDCATLPCAAPLRVAPADVAAGDEFGSAVSISGGTLVATSPATNPGAAYIFVNDGSGWTQQAKLGTGTFGERFGHAAALSGDRLAIGADRASAGAGRVYVFERVGATWSADGPLSAADAHSGDAFGAAVALDSDTLLVGAPYVAAPGVSRYANGAAYAFVHDAGGWTQQAKLIAAPSGDGDLFGFAVAFDSDRAAIGAPYAEGSQGVAFVFARNAGVWTQQAELAASAGAVGDEFGWTVAFRGGDVLVGAPFSGQQADAACGNGYLFDGASLIESGGATIEAPIVDQLAGWAIAASGDRWIMSAPGHLVGSADHAGAAYWFDPTITLFHSGFDASGACNGAALAALAR